MLLSCILRRFVKSRNLQFSQLYTYLVLMMHLLRHCWLHRWRRLHCRGLSSWQISSSRVIAAGATSSVSNSVSDREAIHTQLNNYIADMMEEDVVNDAMHFWGQSQKLTRYSKLYELAQDLLSAPASQAYVERIFSMCGFLTTRRRNRMHQSLEMRAFLKLNSDL